MSLPTIPVECSSNKHGEVQFLCFCAQGTVDPRYCPHCEKNPETRKHKHDTPISSVIAIHEFNYFLMSHGKGWLEWAEGEYERVKAHVTAVKDSLDNMLASYQDYVNKVQKEQLQLGDGDVVERIRKGAWEELRCQDIKRITVKVNDGSNSEVVKKKVKVLGDELVLELRQMYDTVEAKREKTDFFGEFNGQFFGLMERLKTDDQRKKVKELTLEVRENPEDAEKYFKLGKYLADTCLEYDLAEKNYHKCLKIDPGHNHAKNSFGVLEINKNNNYEQAEKWLLQAVDEKHPDNHLFLENLGRTYYNLKDYVKSEEYLNLALKTNPKNAVTYFVLGGVYMDTDKFEKAATSCSTAIELGYGKSTVYTRRAKCYEKLGKKKEAEADRNKAKEIDGAK